MAGDRSRVDIADSDSPGEHLQWDIAGQDLSAEVAGPARVALLT